MKTASIPSGRVEPELQAEFIARGLRSLDEARRTGDYVDADVVVAKLQCKLDDARARIASHAGEQGLQGRA